MKILIVGAGVAGLSLAGFCEKLGIRYTLVEKQKDQSHHGYSLGLWSNARKMLEKLDLADRLDEEGAPVRFLNIRTGAGKLLRAFNLAYFSIQYGGYTMIERSKVIDWLSSRVSSENIRFGLTVEDIQQKEKNVSVTFSNNTKEEYDLVVGADGISSQVRQLVFAPHEYRTFTNWRVWYAWIDKKNVEPHTVTKYIEPNEYAVTFDVGNKALACFVTHVDHSVWDQEDGRIERLKVLFKEESVLVPSVFSVQKSGEILPTDLSEIQMDTLYKGRVVLLGDAAHGFEPFAGIGSSMAMEDAYVLVSELMHQADVSQALGAYQRKRKTRVELARKLTARMQAWATIRSKILRYIVNFCIPYVPERIFLKSYDSLLKKDL